MNNYLQLVPAALFPVAVSILLYLIDKKTPFGKLNYTVKQIIFGIIFGGVAVFGTEFGISIMGVVMNVRDAAPICAGLIFGPPAGIISGLIGGIERFLRAPWVGEYTKLACSVSTALAGIFAAWLRKYMFENKKPGWVYGLATGIIAEVVHMLMLFVTHITDAKKCFEIIQKCAVPMTLFSGLSVMLAIIAVTVISREKVYFRNEKLKISQTFQRRLLICILVAFTITSAFTVVVQTQTSVAETKALLDLNVQDVKKDISDASDENLLSVAHAVAADIEKLDSIDEQAVKQLAEKHNAPEINIIDENGIVAVSTDSKVTGFDMSSGKQAAEFLMLLGDEKSLVQEYQPISRDSDVWRKYAGVKLEKGGFIQVGYTPEYFQKDISAQVEGVTRNRHVGETGYVIICDENFNIVSDPHDYEGQNLDKTGIYIYLDKMKEGDVFTETVYGEKASCMYTTNEGFYIIAVRPESEALFLRDMSIYMATYMEILIFTALFILIYFLIKRLIVNNIRKINSDLSRITNGDLDVTVNVRSNAEFASLSDDINSTVVTLKHYIDDAAARIDKELEFAQTIQLSALPSVFPPYPNRNEFDIWAGMKTAKEVGGDFYDFYLIGEDKLAFLIADVSGKGIPAALFMMTAKTMLKNLAETGIDVNEVFTHANEQLCESNEAGMFVTAWMGILDLTTGLLTYANAGHNPPLVKRGNGQFEYLKSRAGFVLAGMDGIVYRKNELQLEAGDIIYLYTDGVTEATDSSEQLYGDERLQNKLNGIENADAETICRTIKSDVDRFVGSAPQFDDITMLCVEFKKKSGDEDNMKELTLPATLENIAPITEFIDRELELLDCPMKAQMQIDVAVDEMFSNIARYAYAPNSGDATVRFTFNESTRCVSITFIDSGIPYNPIKKADPDTTLSAEEREIGGLGIFLVKKTMDDLIYEYKDEKNILTIKKNI